MGKTFSFGHVEKNRNILIKGTWNWAVK